MIASSALVLVSLTATGLWLGQGSTSKEEDYVVDLSAIENNAATGIVNGSELPLAENMTRNAATADDLDYDPYFQETNSLKIENPDQSGSDSMSDGAEKNKSDNSGNESAQSGSDEQSGSDSHSDDHAGTDDAAQETIASEAVDAQDISTAMQPALNFTDEDTLVWPIVGNVLVNYSMDKTVYFPTLQQYKYNPAIIIEAAEGDLITAAAAGKVTSVYSDPQLGNAVTMELGSGYEITYGQLTNILVSEGSFVAMGDVIAEVAAPTKYYSVEGTNVYFKLTKDGTPVNPMTKLG